MLVDFGKAESSEPRFLHIPTPNVILSRNPRTPQSKSHNPKPQATLSALFEVSQVWSGRDTSADCAGKQHLLILLCCCCCSSTTATTTTTTTATATATATEDDLLTKCFVTSDCRCVIKTFSFGGLWHRRLQFLQKP